MEKYSLHKHNLPPILIFKGTRLLGNAFKHLEQYTPEERERCIVREIEHKHSTIYVKVSCKKGDFVLNEKHFWKPKVYKLLQHLESIKKKTPGQQKIIDKLIFS